MPPENAHSEEYHCSSEDISGGIPNIGIPNISSSVSDPHVGEVGVQSAVGEVGVQSAVGEVGEPRCFQQSGDPGDIR